LTQSDQESHSGIAVGRLHTDLALEIADAAIGATGIEVERDDEFPPSDFDFHLTHAQWDHRLQDGNNTTPQIGSL
jgi:hypothetical protein